MVPHGKKITYVGDLMFRMAKITVIAFGYWKAVDEWSPRNRNFYNWFIRLIDFSVAIVTIQAAILPFAEMIIEKDIKKVLEHMPISMAAVLIYIRVRYCHKKTILALIEESVEWANINFKEYATAARLELIYCKVLNIVILIFTVAGCFSFAYMNKVLVNEHKRTSKELQRYLWYPFHPGKYEIQLYYIDIARLIPIGFLNFCNQVVFTTIIIDCSAKWKVLQYKFANLYMDGKGNTINTNKEAYARLKTMVKEHQTVINYTTRLNDIFKYLLFFEYNFSSLMIAGFLVQIIEGRNHLFNIPAVFILTSQLLLLCYNANEIGVQSTKVCEALYESLWYLYGKEVGRTTQIIMSRSARPLYFTIGFLGPLTATSGVEVLKVAYTFISFMSGTGR